MGPTLLSRIALTLKEREAWLRSWLSTTPADVQRLRLGGRSSIDVDEHAAVVANALHRAEANELGRCIVCHLPVEEHWLETNYTADVCLSHLSNGERRQLEADLELSQKVQRGLLPQRVPAIVGWEVAAYNEPASIVGGDCFDFLRFEDGAHAIIIADVMGKGLPASLLMAGLQAMLRIIVPESLRPHEVLERVNRLFLHNAQLTKFVSMVVVRVEEGSHVIQYANGGHHPPMFVGTTRHSRAHLLPLRPTGAAIGLVEHATFRTEELSIETGESIFMYTDGLVEARAPGVDDEFGEDRIRDVLSDHAGAVPSALIREMRSRLQAFTGGGPPFDDTTLLALKRTL